MELSVAHLEDKQERDFEKHKKVREDNQVMMNNDFELFQESNAPFQFLNNDCMSYISHTSLHPKSNSHTLYCYQTLLFLVQTVSVENVMMMTTI